MLDLSYITQSCPFNPSAISPEPRFFNRNYRDLLLRLDPFMLLCPSNQAIRLQASKLMKDYKNPPVSHSRGLFKRISRPIQGPMVSLEILSHRFSQSPTPTPPPLFTGFKKLVTELPGNRTPILFSIPSREPTTSKTLLATSSSLPGKPGSSIWWQ